MHERQGRNPLLSRCPVPTRLCSPALALHCPPHTPLSTCTCLARHAALPTLDIAEGALNTLIETYKRLLPRLGGYLTNAGDLNHERLEVRGASPAWLLACLDCWHTCQSSSHILAIFHLFWYSVMWLF